MTAAAMFSTMCCFPSSFFDSSVVKYSLEYCSPSGSTASPRYLTIIAHWQTMLVVERLEPLTGLARDHRIALVSPGAVDTSALDAGFRAGALTRDPDGHGLVLVTASR